MTKEQITAQIQTLLNMAVQSSADANSDTITESIIDAAGHLMAARRSAAQIGMGADGSGGAGMYAAGASS